MRDIHKVTDLAQLMEFIADELNELTLGIDATPQDIQELTQVISQHIHGSPSLRLELLGCKCRASRFTTDRLARNLINQHYNIGTN